jgi:hypothetical protein
MTVGTKMRATAKGSVAFKNTVVRKRAEALKKAAAAKKLARTKKQTSTKRPASPNKSASSKKPASSKLTAAARLADAKQVAVDLVAATELVAKAKKVTEIQTPIEAALRAKARRELGRLDYIRSVRDAVQELGQAAVARALSVSQPSISKLLAGAEARGVGPVAKGFSGAGPYEIAERYAAGDIDREAMIRELSAWPYVKNEGAAAAAAEWESTPYVETPGSFAEVGRAFDEGLIDGDAYDQILDASDDV